MAGGRQNKTIVVIIIIVAVLTNKLIIISTSHDNINKKKSNHSSRLSVEELAAGCPLALGAHKTEEHINITSLLVEYNMIN